MTIELNAALGGISAAVDLLRGGLAARDDAKIQAALQSMSARLTEALMSALHAAEKAASLEASVRALEADKRQLQTKLDQRASYALHEPRPGAFVYAFRPTVAGDQQPAHYLCQTCYDKDIKSVLQRSTDGHLLCCLIEPRHNLRITDRPVFASAAGHGFLA